MALHDDIGTFFPIANGRGCDETLISDELGVTMGSPLSVRAHPIGTQKVPFDIKLAI